MNESFKDTDLREALRRKYSDTPQLPADFMAKMQEQMDQNSEPSTPKPATKIRLWHMVAAAASILLIIGIGVTMLPKDEVHQTKDIYAQTNITDKTDKVSGPTEQQVGKEQPNKAQEETLYQATNAKANSPVEAEARVAPKASPSPKASPLPNTSPSSATPTLSEVSSSPVSPADYRPANDDNLYYASQSLTEDTAYQSPHRMEEFITKIAEYNKVKAVPLDCISNREDSTVVNTAYIFQDTKELDLFGRLLQAACWYDSKTPGYLLNFSHQQFFFTLKDLRKGEKYIWIAERVNGGRILLFTTHSPIDANVSSACYQKYREQLTHIHFSSL